MNGNKLVPLKQGDFVIITYEGEKFPAEVTEVESTDPSLVTVKCMKKDRTAGSIWCWPKHDDKVEYYNMYDCEKAQKPKLYGSLSDRVIKFYVSELAYRWVLLINLSAPFYQNKFHQTEIYILVGLSGNVEEYHMHLTYILDSSTSQCLCKIYI